MTAPQIYDSFGGDDGEPHVLLCVDGSVLASSHGDEYRHLKPEDGSWSEVGRYRRRVEQHFDPVEPDPDFPS